MTDETAPPVAVRPEPLVQLGMGLPEHTIARLDRLRAATGFPRGTVVEMALSGQGLTALEATYHEGCARFELLAARAGVSWTEYARDYAERFAHKRYPPTVGELEELDSAA